MKTITIKQSTTYEVSLDEKQTKCFNYLKLRIPNSEVMDILDDMVMLGLLDLNYLINSDIIDNEIEICNIKEENKNDRI